MREKRGDYVKDKQGEQKTDVSSQPDELFRSISQVTMEQGNMKSE